MEQFLLLAVMIVVLIPLLQALLVHLNFRGNHIAIAVLMFFPGFCFRLWFMTEASYLYGKRYGRSELLYSEIEFGAYLNFLLMCVVTIPFVIMWCLMRRIPRENLGPTGESLHLPSIWKPSCVILGFFLVLAVYLGNYKTLEDAVKLNDTELVRRRLEFNLLGVGPNNGGICQYSGGLYYYPLLPIAVHYGNKEMVDLLLEHGADLSPEEWYGAAWDDTLKIGKDNGNIEHNPLFYAIFNNNHSMLKYLLDKGADPTQGVSLAVCRKDTEILADLLKRGGDPNKGLGSASDDPVMLEYLLQMGADRAKALRLVIGYGRIRTLAYLMTIGVEMDEIRAACGDCNLPLDELDAWVQRGCDLSDPWLLGLQG
jgi:hypothetical protein